MEYYIKRDNSTILGPALRCLLEFLQTHPYVTQRNTVLTDEFYEHKTQFHSLRNCNKGRRGAACQCCKLKSLEVFHCNFLQWPYKLIAIVFRKWANKFVLTGKQILPPLWVLFVFK